MSGLIIILLFLGHHFRTRNPSKSSKVSKNSDYSLVSNKNLSKILSSSTLGQGPYEVGQKGLKILYSGHHSQKSLKPKTKICFSLQTWRLAESFEGLNSSSTVARPVMQLLRQPKATWFRPNHTDCEGVKTCSKQCTKNFLMHAVSQVNCRNYCASWCLKKLMRWTEKCQCMHNSAKFPHGASEKHKWWTEKCQCMHNSATFLHSARQKQRWWTEKMSVHMH